MNPDRTNPFVTPPVRDPIKVTLPDGTVAHLMVDNSKALGHDTVRLLRYEKPRTAIEKLIDYCYRSTYGVMSAATIRANTIVAMIKLNNNRVSDGFDAYCEIYGLDSLTAFNLAIDVINERGE